MIRPDECGLKWDEHWPLPKALQKSPQGKQAFTEQRDRLKHTLGNLTLVAGSLSRKLHALEDWAERETLAKGEVLAEVACGVWMYPEGEREVS